MKSVLVIAAGGAVGAVLRHFVAGWVAGLGGEIMGMPVGILACNILGSAAMGALAGAFLGLWHPPMEVRLLLTTGLLGAFTTFSTFSLETILLLERGRTITATVYIGLSVVLSVSALFAAMQLVRWVARSGSAA